MEQPADFREITVASLPRPAKLKFRLPVSRHADGHELAVPIWVVRGAAEGPVLCANAGTHGNEHEGQTALHIWWDRLDPTRLGGTIVIVPHLNVAAALAYARTSPSDQLDINRIFPGRADGYLAERIAHLFMQHIASQVDRVVDIHSGGPMTDTMPCTLYREVAGQPAAEKAVELARATLVPVLWVAPARLGGAGCTLSEECINRGIPAVTFEMGGRGAVLRDCLDHILKALDNITALMGIAEGKPVFLDSYATVSGWFTHTEVGGVLLPTHRTGDHIAKGTALGEIRDFSGEVRERLVAEHDGILLSQRVCILQPGDWVLALGRHVEPA